MKHFASLSLRALAGALAAMQLFTAAAGAAFDSAFSYSYPVGEGTSYTRTEGKNSAGYQRANILTYTPNGTVTPRIIYAGDDLYGSSSTVLNAASYLQNKSGGTVIGGVNADFFVMSSGIPIGLVIDEGELISSDGWQYAIGFQADGTAVIGRPTAYMNLTGSSGTVSVSYFNKTRTTAGAYLLDRNYDDSTHFTANGTSIVLERLDDTPVQVGGTVRMKVVQTITGNTALSIANNQMVLTKSDGASVPSWVDFADGEEVTLSVSAPDASWNSVRYAVGGKLLVDAGTVTTSGIDAASTRRARTAIGLKSDGTVVVYEIDGDQSSYSIGLTAAELGEEMKSLGCTTVLCLDGGGSSIMALRQPGDSTASVASKPSDGSPRAVANYIFFVTSATSDGAARYAVLTPSYRYVLPGGSTWFSVKGADASYGAATAPTDLTYTVSGDLGTVDGQTFTAGMNAGTATVQAESSGVTGSMDICITQAVESITLQNDGKDVSAVSVKPGQTYELDALAYRLGTRMGAKDELFTWTVSGEIGSISASGLFTAGEVSASGSITCAYGNTKKTVTVNVGMGDPQSAETVADFESAQPLTGTTGLTLSRVTGYDEVARGAGSLKAAFDSTKVAAATLYPTHTDVSDMHYLSLWARLTGVSGTLTAVFTDADDNELTAALSAAPDSTWKQLTAAIPDGAQTFTGLRLTRGAADETDAALYLDQIVVSAHHAITNSDAPTLSLDQSALTVSAGAAATVTGTATMESGKFPVRASNIAVKVDGKTVAGAAKMSGSTLTVTTGALAAGTHCVTIDAWDDAGNRTRKSVTITAGDGANPFADTTSHWARGYAALLSQTGVMQGETQNGQTVFNPNRNLRRMEFAVTMARLLGLDTSYTGATDFADDASIPSWARGAVYAVSQAGIMNGKSTNGQLYFSPSDEMTRAEVMTVIGRTLPRGFAAASLPYTDAAAVPSWATDQVKTCVSAGIIGGYSDNTLRPLGQITRGEIAKILALL